MIRTGRNISVRCVHCGVRADERVIHVCLYAVEFWQSFTGIFCPTDNYLILTQRQAQ